MDNDPTFEKPTVEDVSMAVEDSLDKLVSQITPIDRGVNSLFQVALDGGSRVVFKAPRYATEDAFLAEPAVLSRIARETSVPVPQVLGTARVNDGPLDVPYYLIEYVEGQQITSLLDVSPANRPRLVREAATHLAAVHEIQVTQPFGPLCHTDTGLSTNPSFESWGPLFEDLVNDLTSALLGNGPLTDVEPRFADLEPEIRTVLTDSSTAVAASSPPAAILLRDYRPVNFILASSAEADRLVIGVIDASGLIGDALFDVAKTEDSLIDVPFGQTAEAEDLRTDFRRAYAKRRGSELETLFADRYPCYRLYARTYRLKAFDYSLQFARESDPDVLERRYRSFVDERLAEIRG